MPVLQHSSYRAPWLLDNGHLLTIYPSLFRPVTGVTYVRERITTSDGDFLDLDYSTIGSNRIAVLTHGLEGDSQRPYMLGMVRALNRAGWDAVAWNCRGCSGEMNRLPRFYHSGATEDLRAVVAHLLRGEQYDSLSLIGFSLGGNMTLKYLGERELDIPHQICCSVTFSVPCDLASSAGSLARPSNRLYMHRFLRSLRTKIEQKRQQLPGTMPDVDFGMIRSFHEFDEYYTAPLHGFSGAADYWEQCSSRRYLEGIRVPSLLINAQDDPFLAPLCYPVELSQKSRWFSLETPRSGGHVGFVDFAEKERYWSERRAVEFLNHHVC